MAPNRLLFNVSPKNIEELLWQFKAYIYSFEMPPVFFLVFFAFWWQQNIIILTGSEAAKRGSTVEFKGTTHLDLFRSWPFSSFNTVRQ